MADVKEYLVRIDGDTSRIEAAADRVQAKFDKISNTEVSLKVKLGKNAADIKPLLKEIQKVDPVVHAKIQFDNLQEAEARLKAMENLESSFSPMKPSERSKAIEDTLTSYISALNKAEDEMYDAMDNGADKDDSKIIGILKEALNYTESLGNQSRQSIKDLIGDIRDFAGEYTDSLKNFSPEKLFDFNVDRTKALSGLSDAISNQADKVNELRELSDEAQKALEDIENKKINIDSSDAVDSVKKVGDTIDEVEEKVSQKQKVRIFDGVSEQVYDVEKDFDALMQKLQEVSKTWDNIGFHKGDLREGKFRVADDLSGAIKHKRGSTPGTGTYFASNLSDILGWSNSNNIDRGIFATDISRIKDLLLVQTDKYYDDLTELFGAIHAIVMRDVFPEDTDSYEKQLGKIKNASDIFNTYKTIFDDFGISLSQFSDWLSGEYEYIDGLIVDGNKSNAIKETVGKSTIGSRFMQNLLKKNGIDAHNTVMNDSTALGTVIYGEIAKKLPTLIDFGGNEEIAKKFNQMVLEKIVNNKLVHGADPADLFNNFFQDMLENRFNTITGKLENSNGADVYDALVKSSETGDAFKMPSGYFDVQSAENIQKEIEAQKELADVRKEAATASKEEIPYESHADEINKEAEAYEKYAEAQRIAAIQGEYYNNNMGVDSSHDYDRYMKLNELAGEYAQTMREIEDLKYSGSNNEDIQERISLLKLLAQKQAEAFHNIATSQDMRPIDVISRAFGGTPRIWSDMTDGSFKYLMQDNEEYLDSIQSRMLSLWKELPSNYYQNIGDRAIDPNLLDVMSSIADEQKRIKEAGEEASDEYQRQLDEEAQELAEKKAREEEYRREQEEAAREAAEEERRYAEEMERRAKIEDEQRLAEEYKKQLEKKVRDANEQALKEQESQYSPTQEYDVFADQYAEETEGERQLASAINERAEATEKAALNQKNLESQNVVDDIIKQQEAIKKYNQELYESKGMSPTTDDYDSYYDSDGVGRYIEQAREAREETERLNEVVREGFVQDDGIVEQTENLNKNTEAVKKNADANKEASDKKDKIKAEGLGLDKQASLQRLDALEQKLKEVGIASKELEDGFANAKKAIADAADTSELANANKRIRNLATEVNAKVKRRQVEVDYSSELSALGKLKNEIVESSEASSELKAKAKDMFEAFSNSESFAESNVNKLKSAIKDLNSEFKESKKEFATRNTTSNTRMSGYIDRLNSYNPDKYTVEVREKMTKLREDLAKLPRDAAGNFKIDLDDENVAKQVAKIDAAMNDLKESVRSADGVLANGISVKKLNQQMAQFVDKNHRLTDEYKQDIKELREALNDDGLTKSGYMDVLGQFKDVQARAADEGLIGGVGNLENLGNQIKRMSTNFVAQYFSLYDIVRYARELGQTVTEINSAQTELRKVSDASQTRIQENFKTSAETAQEMGATISDVIASTSDWARLGYSVDDAEVLARNTALYQSVGDNMTQESASEYLTSIMKGYQLDADKSESIIDKVNEVANNYSIDTQGLGEALQRSASAFNTAHTDLDKSIAIITASNEVLQDPEKVGTMWNTVSARIRGKIVPIYDEDHSLRRAKINVA